MPLRSRIGVGVVSLSRQEKVSERSEFFSRGKDSPPPRQPPKSRGQGAEVGITEAAP